MNEQKAHEILADWITEEDELSHCDPYINADSEGVTLDGGFAAEQLAAIAWWMKNKLK